MCIICMQIGSVLERNFTKSFEIFSALAAKGNPIGQQVCVLHVHVCIYMLFVLVHNSVFPPG